MGSGILTTDRHLTRLPIYSKDPRLRGVSERHIVDEDEHVLGLDADTLGNPLGEGSGELSQTLGVRNDGDIAKGVHYEVWMLRNRFKELPSAV